MARGTTRAPSQNAYRGSLGKTQQSTVHVAGPRGTLVAAQVYTTIDAVSDPELVERLHSEDPARSLNVVRFDGGEPVRVAVPVVYHDPAAELLVLVLPESCRHRELDERIRLLERLRDDNANVPAYAKDFAVVYGAAALRGYLEERAQQALAGERQRLEGERQRLEHDKRARELERRTVELEVAKTELVSRMGDIERTRAELARERTELDRLRSEARNRVIAAAQKAAEKPAVEAVEATTISPPPRRETEMEHASERSRREGDSVATTPVPKSEVDEIVTYSHKALNGHAVTTRAEHSDEPFESDIATGVVNAVEVIRAGEAAQAAHAPNGATEFDEETTGSAVIPQGSDPLTTDTDELPSDGVIDSWLEKAIASGTSAFTADGGVVRLALVVGEQVARGFGGVVDVRVLLHRTATYPVVTFVFGPPAALRVPSPTQLAIVPVDIGNERDRHVVATLAKKFEITVELVSRGKRIRRFRLGAPLTDNVGYIVRAADDHLRGVAAEGEPSFARARELVTGAGYDVLGVDQPDFAEFRDDKLAQIETAQQLRRAIAMARRFARPSREDYLVCTRGFPLPRWRELRKQVVESAVRWGLWMGPELAQVAVSEGLARSRRDLVVRLERGFEALQQHPTAFDIDPEAADDNAKALADEAKALGVDLAGTGTGARAVVDRAGTGAGARAVPERAGSHGGGAIKSSDDEPVASGSIGATPPKGSPRPKSTEELIAQLEDRQHRVAAAIELCERADARAAAPVIAAVTKMSRAEAVRVLGMSVKFGDAAKIPLLEGLGSSKSFLRHGCALALALLRTEDGTQAVIDLLLTEPTEIWREVARAIGQVGPTALLPLASTYGRLGEKASPVAAERVAWAMAHVAVRGGKTAVETMAGGQSVVAPVAKKALELHASAAKDHVRVRPGADGSQAGRDVTVNRAFSRRFFEALEQGIPDAGQAGLVDLDASSPMELLDESDLIEDAEDEVDLDESDLIQT